MPPVSLFRFLNHVFLPNYALISPGLYLCNIYKRNLACYMYMPLNSIGL